MDETDLGRWQGAFLLRRYLNGGVTFRPSLQKPFGSAGICCPTIARRCVLPGCTTLGTYRTVADTGYHPLDGARYLRSLGWDQQVCRLVAHHTDAARQAEGEGLSDDLSAEFPPIDGLEQDILWCADATTGPGGERFTLDERINEIAARYGSDHRVTARMIASRPVLEAAISRVAGASTQVLG